MKYNGVLRGLSSDVPYLRQQFQKLCMGNKYCTTLHVINSCVVKLSKLTYAGKIYRGISGRFLPQQFLIPNEFGVKGGIEGAFMSTTTNREVAMAYASNSSVGFVFEIMQGMVDRGADIAAFSQYKHEKEILFAPLTGLEVQRVRVEGSVLVISVSLSVNLTAATIEQVVGKRRKLLADMGENMGLEVRSLLDSSGYASLGTETLRRAIANDVCVREAAWFNDDSNFEHAVQQVNSIA